MNKSNTNKPSKSHLQDPIGYALNLVTEQLDARTDALQIDWSIIHNIEEYVDCDIHIRMPDASEYLVRVFLPMDSNSIEGPTYRYAPNPKASFGEDVPQSEVPERVSAAVQTLLPSISLALEEEKTRRRNNLERTLDTATL